MKQLNILVWLIVIVFTACTTSNHVSSGRFIQKRKYSKGYSMNNLVHWKKTNKDMELTILKSESDNSIKRDTVSVVQSNKRDSVLIKSDLVNAPIEPSLADQSNNLLIENTDKKGNLIERQINVIREDVSVLKQLSKKENKIPDSSSSNKGKWKLLVSILLSILVISFAILIVAEIVSEIGIFGVIAPYLLVIGSFLLMISYINKRTIPFNAFEIAFLILSILLITLGLLFMSFIAAGWTLIFIIASGILFLIMAVFLTITLRKSSKKFKHQKVEHGKEVSKKPLMILLAITGLFIIITALLANYSKAFLLTGIFIWVCILLIFTTLIYLIWFVYKKRKV